MEIRGARPSSQDTSSPDHPSEPVCNGDVVARLQRAAAHARLDELISNAVHGFIPCNELSTAGRNYDPRAYDDDRCPRAPVEHATLFGRQDNDVHEVEPSDVHQGQLGDCYLLAALGALAASDAGRALLQRSIVENRDPHGQVVSYTVLLHRAETHLLGLGRTTFTTVPVTVDASFTVHSAFSCRTKAGDQEVWPLVVERAYAAFRGGYDAIRDGGQPSIAMQILTGLPAAHIPVVGGLLAWQSYGAKDLQRDLQAGRLITLSTRSDAQGYGLIGDHAYFVTASDMTTVDGRLCVKLHNPHGMKNPDPVPLDKLAAHFRAVDVGSVESP
jgi:hypothetical protein